MNDIIRQYDTNNIPRMTKEQRDELCKPLNGMVCEYPTSPTGYAIYDNGEWKPYLFGENDCRAILHIPPYGTRESLRIYPKWKKVGQHISDEGVMTHVMRIKSD